MGTSAKGTEALAPLLGARGFVRRGSVFVREVTPIIQAVGAPASRFALRRAGYFWIETAIVYGDTPTRARSLAAYQQSPNVLASIRHNELGPSLPPYFDPNSADEEWLRAMSERFIPFLDRTTTVQGLDREFGKLGDGRMLARAVLSARAGLLEQARERFTLAPGDPAAIRRLAESLGVSLP